MNSKELEKVFEYWISESKRNFSDMNFFFESKKFMWALFVGHLAIEKLLKALIISVTKQHAPHTHNLRRLAEISKISLTEDDISFLEEVTEFNISTRYPEIQNNFYAKCDYNFTKSKVTKINKLYKELCNQIKES